MTEMGGKSRGWNEREREKQMEERRDPEGRGNLQKIRRRNRKYGKLFRYEPRSHIKKITGTENEMMEDKR